MTVDTQALVSQFEHRNAAHAEPTRALLARFVGDGHWHARFLNTLSMLEHLGSHKIMATQHGAAIAQPTLKHLAEDARHAFFFKRHADREAGRTMNYATDALVAPASARRYVHRLEAEIVRALPAGTHASAPYLLMSMIVEFRAVWAYRLYHAALDEAGHRASLRSLLAEEEGHLNDMASRLHELDALDHGLVARLVAIEERLYVRLLSAFAGALPTLPISLDNALAVVTTL